MSNFHGRMLYTTKVDGMKSGGLDVNVGIYGIFKSDASKGHWDYYLISYKITVSGDFKLTNEWHSSCPIETTYETIMRHSKSVSSIDEGRKICDEYKLKWTSGSNDTIQERREEKISEILK
jgi:hypothetical protein